MKKIIILIVAVLSVIPLGAQRIPAYLENPAAPELERSYERTYRSYKSSYYVLGAGLGVAAVGYGMIRHTAHVAEMNPDPDGLNEGAAMVMVFEGILTAAGVVTSAEAVALNIWERTRLNRLSEKNGFLNAPGEDLDSWKRYRAACIYDSSRKWKKVSGIATCCLSGYTLAGVIGCRYSDSDFLLSSAETAMWLGFASGATFLVSCLVNSCSNHYMNLQPSLTYLPTSDQPYAGLTLTANF